MLNTCNQTPKMSLLQLQPRPEVKSAHPCSEPSSWGVYTEVCIMMIIMEVQKSENNNVLIFSLANGITYVSSKSRHITRFSCAFGSVQCKCPG